MAQRITSYVLSGCLLFNKLQILGNNKEIKKAQAWRSWIIVFDRIKKMTENKSMGLMLITVNSYGHFIEKIKN